MYLFSQSVYILGKFCHFSPVFRLFINIVVKPTIRKRYRKYRLERRCPTIKFMCSYCRHHLLSKGVAVKTMPATVYGKYGKSEDYAHSFTNFVFICITIFDTVETLVLVVFAQPCIFYVTHKIVFVIDSRQQLKYFHEALFWAKPKSCKLSF